MYRFILAMLLIFGVDVPNETGKELIFGLIYFAIILTILINGANDFLKEIENDELRETDRND